MGIVLSAEMEFGDAMERVILITFGWPLAALERDDVGASEASQ